MRNHVEFVRPRIKATKEFKEVYDRWKAGEITVIKAIQELGIKKTTFYKIIREYKEVLQK